MTKSMKMTKEQNEQINDMIKEAKIRTGKTTARIQQEMFQMVIELGLIDKTE